MESLLINKNHCTDAVVVDEQGPDTQAYKLRAGRRPSPSSHLIILSLKSRVKATTTTTKRMYSVILWPQSDLSRWVLDLATSGIAFFRRCWFGYCALSLANSSLSGSDLPRPFTGPAKYICVDGRISPRPSRLPNCGGHGRKNGTARSMSSTAVLPGLAYGLPL